MISSTSSAPASGARRDAQYCCEGSLLAHGPETLHDQVASRMETAMGKGLPQMEVRLNGLSLSAQIPVSGDGDTNYLPTIYNDIKQGLLGKSTIATKRILRNVNAVFRPGTMTLVLGQPGSGKSALLKVLSGRFPMSKTIQLDGEITYNGISREAMGKRLPQFVGYVGQRDHHFPTLSVKETLAFAHECCGAELSANYEKHFVQGTEQENKIAVEAARAMNRHYPQIVTRQLGLEHCQDTVVGDAMLRGVSGGERKRVTIGEMEFGNRYATFLDEVSTGLDSAATFDIMKTQHSLATKFRRTVVAALLQPSPEVFSLFDSVLILNEGHVIYYGPRADVVPYFASLGFTCPPDRDVADFLMDLGTDHQWQYTRGSRSNRPQLRQPAEFASAFQASTLHASTVAAVLAPHEPTLLNDVDHHFQGVPEFHQTFLHSVWTLMKRESRIVLRNDALLKGRAAMITVVGLLFATLFYQFNDAKIQLVLGTVFSAILFLAMGQASQVSTFMVIREVFYKQRAANFYSTPAYVLAVSLSQVPIALIETVVFGSMIYWMCGFVVNVGEFLVFELVLFSTTLAFVSWFFFLSAISPNLQVGEPLGTVSLLFFILFAGFIITKDNIPDYFIWAYWFNPFAWCLRALAVNQYRSDEFDVCERDGVDYCATYDGKKAGEYLLSVFQIQSAPEWVWYCVIYMLLSFVIFMVVTAFILEYVRYESPDPVSIMLTEDEKLELVKANSDSAEAYTLTDSPREIAVDLASARYERHFVPITLTFKDLHYSVPDPTNSKEELQLLKGISGYARPGTMTALMGSSGAGKTTLMDVIAGRKTGGKIRGQILLNGHPSTDLAIRRSTGYCEQMDVHSLSSTIREALTFSAFLRQDASVSTHQKLDSVEESLDMLDLRSIADKIVRGSSMEQLKRLTIGVELAAQPSVLFLDEPTSGLDARSAKVIMDGVRKVANTGRTVVCTIHQPSWEVFAVFDNLLLLKRGGETVFFGEVGKDAREMVRYFEAVHGVMPLQKGYNPAAWMLDVIGAGVGNTSGDGVDFVAVFNASEKKAAMDSVLETEGFTRPLSGSSPLSYNNKRAATEATQAKVLLKRFMNMYWRTSDYNLVRFAVFVVLAIIFGLAFRNIKYDTYQGINAGIGMIFVTLIFAGVVSFESVLPLVAEERPSYYRERASQTYNSLWYLLGSTVAEIPYVFVSTLCLCGIFFPMAGFAGAWRFVLFWIGTSLHVLLQTYVGQFLVYALPSIEVAMIAGVMFNGICFLLIGYNPPVESIPGGYKWLHQIVPPKYAFAILGSLVFGECSNNGMGPELGCKPLVGELPPDVPQGTTIQQYVDSVFKIRKDDIWTNFAVVAGYIVLFRLFALLALRFINHQKK